MSNPIATPLVDDVDTGELGGLIRLDTHADGAVVISLLRPALNGAVTAALTEAFETLHGADHVRIVFLRGAGKTFCTGVDPAWLKIAASDWSEADLREEGLKVAGMFRALTAIPALTVALIEGEAIGGGAGLAAACDLAVATADTRFAFPEVTHGAVAALVAPFVVNAIGPRQAKALFATGRTFDAAYAEKIGLVQEIVEDAEGLTSAAERLTEQALATAPGAVAESKTLVWRVWAQIQDHALLQDVAHRFARSRMSEEGREGLAASLEGRRPNWTGD
ncbi:MAG TPA: enoyl-CoA hydratase-related protein [Caulobacteraceae bacterium]|nr:enoyl-CoA hydratase-related protein [Caulobacteraceae bacterium]